MTSQPDYQTISMHILFTITKKRQPEIKFDQLTNYNKRNIFLQKSCRKLGRETSPRSLFVFKKALYEPKVNILQLRFNIHYQSSTRHTIKTNCIKAQSINSEIRSILIFQKRVWKQFLHHILSVIFKVFLMFYSIN